MFLFFQRAYIYNQRKCHQWNFCLRFCKIYIWTSLLSWLFFFYSQQKPVHSLIYVYYRFWGLFFWICSNFFIKNSNFLCAGVASIINKRDSSYFDENDEQLFEVIFFFIDKFTFFFSHCLYLYSVQLENEKSFWPWPHLKTIFLSKRTAFSVALPCSYNFEFIGCYDIYFFILKFNSSYLPTIDIIILLY